jgi:hypothetical protein
VAANLTVSVVAGHAGPGVRMDIFSACSGVGHEPDGAPGPAASLQECRGQRHRLNHSPSVWVAHRGCRDGGQHREMGQKLQIEGATQDRSKLLAKAKTQL